MNKISIDFGTTNTIVAAWRETEQTAATLDLAGLSIPTSADTGIPPLIPSIVYVQNGASGEVLVGREVCEQHSGRRTDERYFSSFKRGITARAHPFATQVDGVRWDESRAGTAFLSRVLQMVIEQEGNAIDELVFSVPVHSFEGYLKWLRDDAGPVKAIGAQVGRIRIVDESTAAALGYNVQSPGDLLLVFDFGGGTLDISLVRMPVAEERSGVILDGGQKVPDGSPGGPFDPGGARVVAKAGRILGGDDVDHWLLEETLNRNDLTHHDIGSLYNPLKAACEAAKLHLSSHETAAVDLADPGSGRSIHATFTRSQLEDLLDKKGFYAGLQKTINQVMRSARARGIFPEDIQAVLMIGGTSLIPSVSRIVRTQFGADKVFEEKPFEAVCHGALKLAVGMGLDDLLYHSYAIRHLSPLRLQHEWEELIPAGTRYPLSEPVQIVLAPSRDGQDAVELVIGEVEEAAGGVSEVRFGATRSILMVEGSTELRRVIPLNDRDGARVLAHLNPPGRAGRDRIKAEFEVDSNRTLRVKVTDLLTDRILLDDAAVAELR